MTESVDTTTPETDAEDAASRERYREKISYDNDLRLDNMLDFTFGVDDEIVEGSSTLTLITAGGIIEGKAVSYKRYADAQINAVAAQNPDIAKALIIVEDGTEEAAKEHKAKYAHEPRALRSYIHFLTATVTTGSQRVPVKELRVDLKNVIGWSLHARIPEA